MAKKRGTRFQGQYTPPKERDPLAPQQFAEQLVARMLINTRGLWTSEVPQFDPDTGRRMRSRWNALDDDDVREGLRQYFVATLIPAIEIRDKLIYTNALAAANPELAGSTRLIDWDDVTDEQLAELTADMDSPQESPLAQAHRQIREQAQRIRELEAQLAAAPGPAFPPMDEVAELLDAAPAEAPEAEPPAVPERQLSPELVGVTTSAEERLLEDW